MCQTNRRLAHLSPLGVQSDSGAAPISRLPNTATTIRCGLTWRMRKAGEMADKQRERRAKTNIDAFLQHTSIGQRRDYLARGRRFGTLDGGQLRESWIIAVRNWLARKDRAAELTMDDLNCDGADSNRHTTPSNRSWPLALEGSVRSRKRELEENSRDKSACSGVRTTSRFTRPEGQVQ